MTIQETIHRERMTRLHRLKELNAPQVLLTHGQERVDQIPNIKGMAEYGNLDVLFSRETYGAKAGKYYLFQTKKGIFALFGGRMKPVLKPFEPK